MLFCFIVLFLTIWCEDNRLTTHLCNWQGSAVSAYYKLRCLMALNFFMNNSMRQKKKKKTTPIKSIPGIASKNLASWSNRANCPQHCCSNKHMILTTAFLRSTYGIYIYIYIYIWLGSKTHSLRTVSSCPRILPQNDMCKAQTACSRYDKARCSWARKCSKKSFFFLSNLSIRNSYS